MDGPGNEYPILRIEVETLLRLPPICVSCGEETSHTTRIDVGVDDTMTELKDVLLGAAGIKLVRTVQVPCCRRCARALNRKTLLAASTFALGLGVFALVPILSGIFGTLPEMLWMMLTFLGVMIMFLGPVVLYARARNKAIPVHVSVIPGPAYRYTFFSHLFAHKFKLAVRDVEPGA